MAVLMRPLVSHTLSTSIASNRFTLTGIHPPECEFLMLNFESEDDWHLAGEWPMVLYDDWIKLPVIAAAQNVSSAANYGRSLLEINVSSVAGAIRLGKGANEEIGFAQSNVGDNVTIIRCMPLVLN